MSQISKSPTPSASQSKSVQAHPICDLLLFSSAIASPSIRRHREMPLFPRPGVRSLGRVVAATLPVAAVASASFATDTRRHDNELRCEAPMKKPNDAPSSSVAMPRTTRAPPRMIISDPERFARKWKKFCTDGLDRLLVITDFDQTLTPQFKPSGEHASSSHGLLMSSAYMNPAVVTAERELFKMFFPIEMSPTLTQEEKMPYMIDWWTRAHDLLVQHGLRRQQLVDAVTHGDLCFRPGFHEIFRVLAEQNVPTLIFSAGLYDVIHEVLDQEFRRQGYSAGTPANVHVVSNMMKFDDKGVLTGFQGNLIHCFNKNASVLLDSAFWRQCQMQKRHNILLMGDSRGDIAMARGLEYAEDEIIRVGFLNVHVEDSLDDYLRLYDVVLTNDASLLPVELLIHQLQ